MDAEKPTIVITGFGPFGIHLKNASWEAVKLLQHMNVEAEFEVTLIVQEIPVAYDDVNRIVPELWERYKPTVRIFDFFPFALKKKPVSVALMFKIFS